MAGNSGVKIEKMSFDREFQNIAFNLYPKYVATGMFQAGAMLIRDTMKEEPFTPKKTGTMRRAQRVDKAVKEGEALSVSAGFDISYAAKVHEMPEKTNWTLAGSGPKFLSTPLVNNREKYTKIVADYCRKKAEANDKSGKE